MLRVENFLIPSISSGRKPYLYVVFFGILIQLLALSLLFFDVSFTTIFLIVMAVPIALIVASSTENFFLFIIAYLSILPLHGYLRLYKGFLPVSVKLNYLYMLFAFFLIYWILAFIIAGKKIKLTVLGYAILIYVCISIFSFIVGLVNANKNVISIGKNELMPQLMYLSYFIILTTQLRTKGVRWFFDFVLIVSVLIGLQFIYAFPQNSIFAFTRIPTRNVHIALLVFPYVIAILLLGKSKKRKILSLCALVPISFVVLISLQRALWLAIAIISFLAIMISLHKRKFNLSKILRIVFLISVGLCALLLLTIFVLSKITSGAAVFVLLKRLLSFVNIGYLKVDLSAFQRTYEIRQVLSRLKGVQWMIGRGIGDINYSKVRFFVQHYIDNSFAWVLWKMGILGLLSFLFMLGAFFHRAVRVLRRCRSEEDTIYSMTIFLNMLGLVIVALTNSCLVHYRFIVFWGISMAMLEIIHQRQMNENIA